MRSLASLLESPSGVLLKPVQAGFSLANNRLMNASIAELQLKCGENVLEIGFGNARSIKKILKAAGTQSSVTAVDHSDSVVCDAARRLEGVANLTLENSPIDSFLRQTDKFFTAVHSCNCIYYWHDFLSTVNLIRSRLSINGRISFGFRQAEDIGFLIPDAPFKTRLDDISRDLLRAGFANIRFKYLTGVHPIDDYVVTASNST